jgi:hypothetical protein
MRESRLPTKNEAQSKGLEKALSALEKFESDSQSMTDKDWGDVIKWVLPAANVDFCLKDLKKRTIAWRSSQHLRNVGQPTYLVHSSRLSLLRSKQHQPSGVPINKKALNTN